jgi:branched-chain amino acid transport system permease protein
MTTSLPEPADQRASAGIDKARWRVQSATRLSRIAGIAAAVAIPLLFALPAFVSRNLLQDLIFVFTMLALAQLWNVLAGWGGLISVGQQAFVGLGAYALFAGVTLSGLDPLLAVLFAGLVAAAVAALLGPLMFRLEGPYFAIGSWVVAEALRLLCAQFKPLGGGTGMSLSGAALANMTGTKSAAALFGLRPAAARDVVVYWLALFLVLAITMSIYVFVRSRLGLGLAASRDNNAAARSIGVRTDRIRYGLWVIVAFATGLVGALVYLQKARISPDAAFSVVDWTAYVLFVVVIGGVRTIEGPILGVLVLWALQFNLAGYGSLYLLVLGLLAIAVMLFLRRGLWGSAAARWEIQLFPVRQRLVRTESEESKVAKAGPWIDRAASGPPRARPR